MFEKCKKKFMYMFYFYVRLFVVGSIFCLYRIQILSILSMLIILYLSPGKSH